MFVKFHMESKYSREYDSKLTKYDMFDASNDNSKCYFCQTKAKRVHQLTS